MMIQRAVLALWFAVQGVGAELPALHSGESLESEITVTDPRVRTAVIAGRPADEPAIGRRFRLELDESGTYTLELRSYFFDGYLVLRGEAGEVLHEDDDGWLRSHSRITRELERGKRYEVDACALRGGRGAFELRLSRGIPDARSPIERGAAEVEDATRAVDARENILGPEDPDTATALSDLGQILWVRGDAAGARRAHQRALAIREKVLGPEHRDTAASLNELALACKAQGDYDAARPLYERALASWERSLGPEHPDTVTSANNLALLLQAQGDFTAARPLFERALVVRERLFGRDHPDTATIVSNLGVLDQTEGDLAAARSAHERALLARETSLGPDHPATAASLFNLSGTLQAQGDLASARPLLERALAIYATTYGPEHPHTARCIATLASLLCAQGDFETARSLSERALAIRERVLGPEHPETLESRNALGFVSLEAGDFAGARPILERSLELHERVFGKDHPVTAVSLDNLASAIAGSEGVAQARPLYERALAIHERTRGPMHAEVAADLNNVALALQAEKNFDAAALRFERAISISEQTVGLDHPATARMIENCALLAIEQHDLSRAFELMQRVWLAGVRARAARLAALSESECYLYLATMRSQLDILLSVAPVAGDAGAQAVLDWKGQVGRTLFESRARLVSELDDACARELESLRAVRSQLSALASTRDIRDVAEHQREIDSLCEAREKLERAVQRSLESVFPPAPTHARLRERLPPGSAFIDVLVHKPYEPKGAGESAASFEERGVPRVSAWITRPDRESCVRIELGLEAKIDDAVARCLRDLRADGAGTQVESERGRAAAAGAAAERAAGAALDLRRLVWDPIAKELDGVTRVFVSPDGALCMLPFEALPYDDGELLIERLAFVYEQSPDVLLADAPAATRAGSLLAVGGVEYESAPIALAGEAMAVERVAGVSAGGSDVRGAAGFSWPALPYTRQEADAIGALHTAVFPGAVRLELNGAEATEERLKRELPAHSVVHVATHGFFHPGGVRSLWQSALDESAHERAASARAPRKLAGQAPGLLSGLVCSGASVEPELGRDDGYLTADEVGWLDLSKTDIVVLSACETALGKSESGEGLLGLRRAFELAGAKTVVSSLWAVQDESTARLMQSFYENLWVKKLGRADALRAAQLAMLAENRARHGDPLPATWAAFVLSGEWR
jgi:CHAT domain-containing protein/tetratricopeptide (TPR) repeat protein